MPIKGKITVTEPVTWLHYLPIHSVRYFPAYEILVTRKALFVNLDTDTIGPVDMKAQKEAGSSIVYIKVTKIGEGLSAKDFEFDITECEQKKYVFVLEPSMAYDELSKDSECLMIPLTDDQLIILTDKEDELVELEGKLQTALDSDDFELAARIRDDIKIINSRKKKSPK